MDYRNFANLSQKLLLMQNEDSNSDIMSIRCLAKRAIEECNNMELLDLVYRILVFDETEGRAD